MVLSLTLFGAVTFWATRTHPNRRFSLKSDFVSIFRVSKLMQYACIVFKLRLLFNVPEWTQQVKKITKKQCPSWPTGREVMTTSSGWVRGYNSTPSLTVQSTPVNRTVERDSAVSGY